VMRFQIHIADRVDRADVFFFFGHKLLLLTFLLSI
jgi:hypothetical protein